jgi:hypothetical protein
MYKFTILLAAFLLLGCASEPQEWWQSVWLKSATEKSYTWYHTGYDPLPMTIHYNTPYDVVTGYCSKTWQVIACAVRRENSCDVYTPFERLNEYIIAHEQKHCDGWNHKEY